MSDFYSIIIPCYNEGDVIGPVLEKLGKPEGCAEVIVIDDGSSDETGSIAESKGAKVITHEVNRGYGAGLKTGILNAKTPYVVLFDGDGQHRIEDLMKIVAVAQEYDMVVGARGSDSHQLAIRKPGKKILGWFVNLLSDREVPDINSGLRSFKVSTIKKYLHLMPEGFSFSTTSTVAFNRMKYKVHYIPIVVLAREGRKSSVKIFRDGFRTIMLITNLTVLFNPMKVFLPIAMLMFLSSFVYFLIYAITIRVHITPSMTMLFVSGILIFCMGILCEQVSATRRELNNRVV